MAKEIEKGAEAAGAEVESVYIHGMAIKPCHACWVCQKPDSKGCAIKDDMQDLFPKLAEADAWVVATPIHWFNMSTQTKLRTRSIILGQKSLVQSMPKFMRI